MYETGQMHTRGRVISFGSAGLLIVLGGLAAILFGGTAGQVAAFVLIALGLVLATSLVFLEVGLSEDRERAREERNETGRRSKGPRSRRQLRVRPLDRSRGYRRRLR